MSELVQHGDKPCEWEDSISIYVLGNLLGEERVALEQHLASGCAKCVAELSRAAGVLAKLAESSIATLPTGFRERFLRLFDKERVSREKKLDQSVIFNKSGVLISRSETIPWQAGGATGIWAKALFVDAEQGCVTSLIRMDPGTYYPSHRHGGAEELFLLSGDIMVEGKLLKTGDYCHAASGSIHGQSFTNSGCTFILRACA